MQLSKGHTSVLYQKLKLNIFNLTIYDIKTHECECYVWDESDGYRGVNELSTCFLRYLNQKASAGDQKVVFYSDNCAGQQKNQLCITHKSLIKGHIQNEGNSVHSLIERRVK